MIKQLLTSTGSNILVLIVKIVITFVMTPIFLQNMGNYDYGLWEIIASIVGYLGILDLGIKPAVTRFTAKYKVEKNQDALKVMYSSAFAFTLFVGSLISIFLICLGAFFPEIIAPESADTVTYSLVFIILGLQMLLVFPGYVPESILEGLQQYSIKNIVTIVNSIVGASVLYYFMNANNGLYVLALVNAVGLSLKYILYFYMVSRSRYGGLIPDKSKVSFKVIKNLLHFGGKSFIQGVAYKIESATDVLVIGYFLSPAMVPIYSIPANLMGHIRNIGFTLTLAFMPKFSELSAKQDRQEIIKFYLNSSKWTIAIILPITILGVIFGPTFITLWLGEKYGEQSQIILLLLAIFTMVPLLDPVMERYLTAINKHAILAKLYPVSALINLLSSIILVEHLGIIGVALGSIIPLCILVPIYLHYSCQQLKIKITKYIVCVLMPMVIPNTLLLVTSMLITQGYSIQNYSSLIIGCVVSSLGYILILWFLTLCDNERKYIISSLFTKMSSLSK
jgi:O-antigen/teichoic acid export membrane protein